MKRTTPYPTDRNHGLLGALRRAALVAAALAVAAGLVAALAPALAAAESSTKAILTYLDDGERRSRPVPYLPDGRKIAVMETNKGTVRFELWEDVAPNTVINFVYLANSGRYDGVTFHRVIEDFMAQTGDVEHKNGSGGPGYTIPSEFDKSVKHERGVVSMARGSDRHSGGSQFFIMYSSSSFLDGQYTAFGRVIEGMDVIDSLKKGDRSVGGSVSNPDRIERLRVITEGDAVVRDSLFIPTPEAPPVLAMSAGLREPSGNRALDAGEQGEVGIEIMNQGEGAAFGLSLSLSNQNSARGVHLGRPSAVPGLAPGEAATVTIDVSASDDAPSGDVALLVECSEANGFGAAPVILRFRTRAFDPPEFEFAGFSLEGPSGSNSVGLGEQGDVTLAIRNNGAGAAMDVRIAVEPRLSTGVFVPGQSRFDFGTLAPGAQKEASFSFFVNREYALAEVTFVAKASESTGRFGRDLEFSVPLNRRHERPREFSVEPEPEPVVDKEDAEQEIGIDIETTLPSRRGIDRSAIAVVIGCRDYEHADVPPVTFAVRDAEVFAMYLERVFGVPPSNILMEADATQATLRRIFGSESNPRGQLASLVEAGVSNVYVYFSGHGAPDLKTGEPYLVPRDCHPAFVSLNGYPLGLLYKNLNSLGAQSLLVAVDACFSGGSAAGPLVTQASPIVATREMTDVPGNGTLFLSCAPDQVSSWYPEKKHGLFTYFFLKGLGGSADADGDGDVTVSELDAYLAESVPRTARTRHNRVQTPIVRGEFNRVLGARHR